MNPRRPAGRRFTRPWLAVRAPGAASVASQTAYELDTPSPLPAIAVYEAVRPLHWDFCLTYGLSELFEKSSEDPDVSGFGFELTMRTPRLPDETMPPTWPLRALQGLGRHVLAQKQGLDTGHCADLGSSIAAGIDSALTCLACVPDPLLKKIVTPFGSLLFLQVVGITTDELRRCSASMTRGS